MNMIREFAPDTVADVGGFESVRDKVIIVSTDSARIERCLRKAESGR